MHASPETIMAAGWVAQKPLSLAKMSSAPKTERFPAANVWIGNANWTRSSLPTPRCSLPATC